MSFIGAGLFPVSKYNWKKHVEVDESSPREMVAAKQRSELI